MGPTLAKLFPITVALPCLDKARVWAEQEMLKISAYQADGQAGQEEVRAGWFPHHQRDLKRYEAAWPRS